MTRYAGPLVAEVCYPYKLVIIVPPTEGQEICEVEHPHIGNGKSFGSYWIDHAFKKQRRHHL